MFTLPSYPIYYWQKYHWKWKCVNITLSYFDENQWKYTFLVLEISKIKNGRKKSYGEDMMREFYRVSKNLFA